MTIIDLSLFQDIEWYKTEAEKFEKLYLNLKSKWDEFVSLRPDWIEACQLMEKMDYLDTDLSWKEKTIQKLKAELRKYYTYKTATNL